MAARIPDEVPAKHPENGFCSWIRIESTIPELTHRHGHVHVISKAEYVVAVVEHHATSEPFATDIGQSF